MSWQAFGRKIAHGTVLSVESEVGGERALRVLREDVLKPVRGNLRGRTKVPFSELGGGVTRLAQAFGEGGLLVEAVESRAVVVEIEAPLETTGEQSASRRHALRGGAVAVLRDDAAPGERVEMGRLEIGLETVNPEVGVTVVVGVDEDHVGARVGGTDFTTEGTEDAEKEKEGFH